VTTEVQWSELARDPKSVAALADRGDVRLRRRDGAPLLLIREDRSGAAQAGSLTAARALRNALAHLGPDEAASALQEEFPWVDQLPTDDVPAFVAEFIRAVGASAELADWSALAQTIVEWKATALAASDPGLLRTLTEPITDDLGPVASPHTD
jgi:hypothetical protein